MEAWIAANKDRDEKAFNARWKNLDKDEKNVRDTFLISKLILKLRPVCQAEIEAFVRRSNTSNYLI